MGEFIKHILTGRDNTTYDIGRVALCAGFLLIAFCALTNPFLPHPIDLEKLALALGGYVLACTGGIAIKAKTEPTANDRT